MKVLVIVFAVFMTLMGCEKTEHPPQNLIPADTLALLLADMHILETAQNTKVLTSDSVPHSYEALYAAMFARYAISNERYDSTMVWLSNHPSDLEIIYDRVIEHLAQRESATR